ncbi:MAG: hypothetical protein NZ960_02475 [Candidatus Kapabacteria bacterium]|nr:hypothetical protein [Candidatus Kapabacteria bacterium]MDW8011889.1 hypothetical protein [Bacteroidota bacterium]
MSLSTLQYPSIADSSTERYVRLFWRDLIYNSPSCRGAFQHPA